MPATQREPPADRLAGCRRRPAAAGGVHVRRAAAAQRASGAVYFQRETPGQPLSATFLADGDRAYCLGFNRLLVEALGDARYCYAGAIAGIDLPPRLARAGAIVPRSARARHRSARAGRARLSARRRADDGAGGQSAADGDLRAVRRRLPGAASSTGTSRASSVRCPSSASGSAGERGRSARSASSMLAVPSTVARQCLLPELVSRSAAARASAIRPALRSCPYSSRLRALARRSARSRRAPARRASSSRAGAPPSGVRSHEAGAMTAALRERRPG